MTCSFFGFNSGSFTLLLLFEEIHLTDRGCSRNLILLQLHLLTLHILSSPLHLLLQFKTLLIGLFLLFLQLVLLFLEANESKFGDFLLDTLLALQLLFLRRGQVSRVFG